jgi:antitoxin MazE
MAKSSSTVQKWGNSLAVRIPAGVARSAGMKVGQPVRISANSTGVLVAPSGELRLNLAQRLALFQPEIHGHEEMPAAPIGKEVL